MVATSFMKPAILAVALLASHVATDEIVNNCSLWTAKDGAYFGTGYVPVKTCRTINKGDSNQIDMCDLKERAIYAHSEWHPGGNPQTMVLTVTSNSCCSATFFQVTLKKNHQLTYVHKIGPGASCTMTVFGTDIETMHAWGA